MNVDGKWGKVDKIGGDLFIKVKNQKVKFLSPLPFDSVLAN